MPQTAPKTDTSTFREIRSAHEAGASSVNDGGGVGVSASPPLKWAGGKRQLLPELRKFYPDRFARYHEPFLGGGAVFFDLRAKFGSFPATLSDSNEILIKAYRGVRDAVDSVIRRLSIYRYDKSMYLDERGLNAMSMSDAHAAAWLIYMNRCGFNGLWRVNSKGKYNVPFGDYDNPTICNEARLRAASRALQGAELLDQDFASALRLVKPGDFVYCDPPYIPLGSTSDFTAYTRDGFTLKDQERLRDEALMLKRYSGAPIVLSNSDTPTTRDLYVRAWQLHPVAARRNINSKASKRGAVGELIIT